MSETAVRPPWGHRPGCSCAACRKWRAGEARLKPEHHAPPVASRGEALVEVIASQVESGELDWDRAAEVAGYRSGVHARRAVTNSIALRQRLREALLARGVTPEKLAAVARGGLGARREDDSPDWRERRGWWELVARSMGVLSPAPEEQQPVQQVAIMVAPQSAHPPDCLCRQCLEEWEERARAVLERRRELLERFKQSV